MLELSAGNNKLISTTMKSNAQGKASAKPFVLNRRNEEILKCVYHLRYVTALDVSYLLYSPKSLTYVRSILSNFSGGEDYKTNQYLYRFQLPSAKSGNKEKVYTLGSRGRDFLANVLGMPVTWHFRPDHVKHFSYAQITHNLILTRFLVAAQVWARQHPDFKVLKIRTGYELAKYAAPISITIQQTTEKLKVIPDAWILIERLKDRKHDTSFPILLEIDRGMEYQQNFKKHVTSRIEFIRSGEYKKMFGIDAVTIAYATTSDMPEYRETRRRAMCAWTQEVLKELRKENWARIFRFHSLSLQNIYAPAIFEEPVWYRPDSPELVPLFS
jgi:hypothetical protein